MIYLKNSCLAGICHIFGGILVKPGAGKTDDVPFSVSASLFYQILPIKHIKDDLQTKIKAAIVSMKKKIIDK